MALLIQEEEMLAEKCQVIPSPMIKPEKVFYIFLRNVALEVF